ncbi:hypothetical protein PR048_032477 [Dryococelus australis]|uniref:Uncharacterized protein n=1 Tax=Dryococelus australis TaxID=614101 RepID=A0ABQ9G2A8_9NEOP|nr:hypothetical protein PR048_032477 [Dryococelus australis]
MRATSETARNEERGRQDSESQRGVGSVLQSVVNIAAASVVSVQKKNTVVHSEGRRIVSNIIAMCDEAAKQKLNQVTARTADYAGVSQTLIKKPEHTVVNIDDFDLFVIRRTIQDFYIQEKHVPTIAKLLPMTVVHAGGINGFIENALLVYKAGTASGDHHCQMNSVNFIKWVTENLAPNLLQSSVVVLDTAPYHYAQIDKPPTKYSVKADMLTWLMNKGITRYMSMQNEDLYKLVEHAKPKEKVYKFDTYLTSLGHTVVRLPPYMCDLNDIELAWVKITIKAIDSVTKTDWEGYCGHVQKLETEYRGKRTVLYILTTVVIPPGSMSKVTNIQHSGQDGHQLTGMTEHEQLRAPIPDHAKDVRIPPRAVFAASRLSRGLKKRDHPPPPTRLCSKEVRMRKECSCPKEIDAAALLCRSCLDRRGWAAVSRSLQDYSGWQQRDCHCHCHRNRTGSIRNSGPEGECAPAPSASSIHVPDTRPPADRPLAYLTRILHLFICSGRGTLPCSLTESVFAKPSWAIQKWPADRMRPTGCQLDSPTLDYRDGTQSRALARRWCSLLTCHGLPQHCSRLRPFPSLMTSASRVRKVDDVGQE